MRWNKIRDLSSLIQIDMFCLFATVRGLLAVWRRIERRRVELVPWSWCCAFLGNRWFLNKGEYESERGRIIITFGFEIHLLFQRRHDICQAGDLILQRRKNIADFSFCQNAAWSKLEKVTSNKKKYQQVASTFYRRIRSSMCLQQFRVRPFPFEFRRASSAVVVVDCKATGSAEGLLLCLAGRSFCNDSLCEWVRMEMKIEWSSESREFQNWNGGSFGESWSHFYSLNKKPF